MGDLTMSPQVFTILSALIAERSGLHFDSDHAAIFSDKVGTRARDVGFESLLDYYYFLRYDQAGPQELDALIELLVIGETYFFRESGPVETAIARFIQPALKAGRRPRIWCAACATGEEPLTIAMLLAARGLLDQVDIVATDINSAAIRRARAGRFSRRALRQELPAFAAPWLEVGEREITVRPALIEAVEWHRLNLMDEAAIRAMGTFDVILCRNVLIYFSEETIRGVVGRLSGQLVANGILLVGVSESLLRFATGLSCEETDGTFVYRKVS